MQPSSWFRIALVASVVLGIVGAFVDTIPGAIPEELRVAYEATVSEEFRTKDILLMVIGLPLFVIAIVSTIGLYRFSSWAPRVALYSTVATVLIFPLLGPQVVSPWSQLLTESSMVLWGVVLAMSFLPPLAERFRGLRANSSMQPTGQERPAAD